MEMREEFNHLIEKAIELELNVAKLYYQFYSLFPSDADFWWQLTIEEKNHAALLKTVQQMHDSHVEIPRDFYPASMQALEESNQKILNVILGFEKHPDRHRALRTAYELENSAGEIHYESFANSLSSSRVANIFQKLNGDDINHAQRIREYMNQLGLS